MLHRHVASMSLPITTAALNSYYQIPFAFEIPSKGKRIRENNATPRESNLGLSKYEIKYSVEPVV